MLYSDTYLPTPQNVVGKDISSVGISVVIRPHHISREFLVEASKQFQVEKGG